MAVQCAGRRLAKSSTPGGEKLKQLRHQARLSLVELTAQLEVEEDKTIDAGHINKIETGRIKKPEVATLETILGGLHARYCERRQVLEAFGYHVPMTLPEAWETNEVIGLATRELQDATYPMCLIDYGQRLWAWNSYAPRIIGLRPGDPATTHLRGLTILDLTFNPALATRLLVDNPEEYLPALLYFIKASIYRFREESWYKELMARVTAFPGFQPLWKGITVDELERYPFRDIIPIRLRVPSGDVLQFRMSNTNVLLDPRFEIIHFTPYGAATLRVCAQWAEEEGVR